jgi:hypothetical protein
VPAQERELPPYSPDPDVYVPPATTTAEEWAALLAYRTPSPDYLARVDRYRARYQAAARQAGR